MVDFNIRVIVDPTPGRQGNQAIRRELRRTEGAADRVGRSIRRAFAAIGGALVIRRLVQFADQFAVLENRVRTVTSGTDQLNTTLDELFQIANRTRTPVDAIVQLYQRGSIAADELRVSNEQLLEFVEKVGRALAVQGGAATQSRGALIQLSQSLGSGIVRAEEFNSILEGAFPIAQAAARGLDRAGGSVARLRRLVIDGEVTSRQFFEAFIRGSQDIDRQFSSTQVTVGQALTRLSNSFLQTFGRIAQTSGATRELVRVLEGFADAVRSDLFRSAVNTLLDGFTRISAALRETIEFLKDPSLRTFLGIGDVLINGVPGDNTTPPGGGRPQNAGGRPDDPISKELQNQIDKAKEFSSELELQNQLIFKQLEGDDARVRQLQVQLELEAAISKEVREARPDIALAIRRQIEEQQELNQALERAQQVQEDFRTVTQDAFETFIDGARRGKLSINDLFNSILDNLIRIQTNRIFDQLFGSGPGSSGALGSNFTNLLGGGSNAGGGFNPLSLLGLQGGATIDVLGRTGTDQNTLSINGRDVARINRGETLGVVPAGAQAGGGPRTIVNVTPPAGAPVQERRRTAPSGDEIVDIVIGDERFETAVDNRIRGGTTNPTIR